MSKSNSYKNRNRGTKFRGTKPPITRDETKANSSKNARRVKEISDSAAALSRTNDVGWYTKYSNYAADAGKIPFATPVGSILKINVGGEDIKYAVPGIMALEFTSTPGISKDFTSPINRSSIQFWTYLRSVQKAFSNYDHQDITMMELALDSCIMYHSLMRRTYGLLSDVTPVNSYYPRSLITSSGFDFYDLLENISDFRAFINEFAYLLQQYAIPKGISVFKRHQWMCEGIYVDGESTRAQTYLFVPKGFWMYDNTVATGSQLKLVPWLGDGSTIILHTFKEVKEYGKALINAISNDEDFGTISGDLYNFYNGDTFQLPFTEELYKILPVYNETVLSQIENATIMGNWKETPIISQNPEVNQGAIVFDPTLALPDSELHSDFTLHMNMHMDSPTSDQVIEATRLMAAFDKASSSIQNKSIKLAICGTEVLNQINVVVRNPETGGVRAHPIYHRCYVISASGSGRDFANDLQSVMSVVPFDWAPRVTLLYMQEPPKLIMLGSTWDYDNVVEVPFDYLANINFATAMSLFMVE